MSCAYRHKYDIRLKKDGFFKQCIFEIETTMLCDYVPDIKMTDVAYTQMWNLKSKS